MKKTYTYSKLKFLNFKSLVFINCGKVRFTTNETVGAISLLGDEFILYDINASFLNLRCILYYERVENNFIYNFA